MNDHFETLIKPSAGFYADEDGIYVEIPDRDYHKNPRASKSKAWKLTYMSTEQIIHERDNPEPPGEDLIAGRYFHAMISDPDSIPHEFGVFDGDLRSKAAKAEYQDLLDEFDGNVIRTGKMADIDGAYQRLIRSPEYEYFLSDERAVHELTILWTEPETGVPMKSRLDLFCPSLATVVDWKTARSAHEELFAKEIANRGYDFQAGMYIQALRQFGMEVNSFVDFAIEKTEPYSYGAYAISIFDCEMSYQAYRHLIKRWDTEIARATTGKPYTTGVKLIGLPGWHTNKIEHLVENEA